MEKAPRRGSDEDDGDYEFDPDHVADYTELEEYDDGVDWTIYYPTSEGKASPTLDPKNDPGSPPADGEQRDGTGQQS